MADAVILADGTPAVIRPIRPDDRPSISKAFSLLSDETRHRRFLSPKPRLTSAELSYLTEVDGRDHVALIAVHGERPEWVLGVGRFVRDRERPDTAEFAILVGDAYQRRGLGVALTQRLIEAARARGVRRFTAWTLSDNVAARRLVEAISEHLVHVPHGDGTGVVVVDLAA